MRIGRLAAVPLIATLALFGGTAQAHHTTDQSDCAGGAISVNAAGPDNPHVTDGVKDWYGPALGNGQVGFGDIYRDGTDITAAWIARDGSGTHAVIQVADMLLGEQQVNTEFYLLFDYPDPTPPPPGPDVPDKTRRWVSAFFKGYAPAVFEWGYQAEGVGGNMQFFPEGGTTGSVTPGPNGTVSIDVPLAGMEIDAGEYLNNLVAETRVLTGSPETLPDPSPVRHGFVQLADSTEEDWTQRCDAYLP